MDEWFEDYVLFAALFGIEDFPAGRKAAVHHSASKNCQQTRVR
jgi:hypothetical protein